MRIHRQNKLINEIQIICILLNCIILNTYLIGLLSYVQTTVNPTTYFAANRPAMKQAFNSVYIVIGVSVA